MKFSKNESEVLKNALEHSNTLMQIPTSDSRKKLIVSVLSKIQENDTSDFTEGELKMILRALGLANQFNQCSSSDPSKKLILDLMTSVKVQLTELEDIEIPLLIAV